MSEPQGTSPVPAEALPHFVPVIVEAVDDLKGIDLLVLDLRGLASFTDYLVICTGSSDRHVQAVVDGIRDQLRAATEKPLHTEGYEQGTWVLVDYVDYVVNVFTREMREFYQLERVWRDAPAIVGERPELPAQDDDTAPGTADEAESAAADAVDG